MHVVDIHQGRSLSLCKHCMVDMVICTMESHSTLLWHWKQRASSAMSSPLATGLVSHSVSLEAKMWVGKQLCAIPFGVHECKQV